MKIQMRHKLLSVFLLLIFLMQMGVKVFHVHQESASTKVECYDCEHHLHHGGHLLTGDGELGVCLLCNILNTSFLEVEMVALAALYVVCAPLFITRVFDVRRGERRLTLLRGPPVFC